MNAISPPRERLLTWAQHSLTPVLSLSPGGSRADLTSLGESIGEARIVSLGEGDHFCDEPMQFRNRLFEYLVEEKGFTAIALESGIVESRVVHDYVAGGEGALQDVLSRGVSWTFDQFPQNAALVDWMRRHNSDPHHRRKLNFYGFDVPGSPSNPQVKRGAETALLEALRFLEQVDPPAAARFHTQLDVWLPHIRFDLYRPMHGPGYHRLSQAERDRLTAGICDLIAWLEQREHYYLKGTSAEQYRWAYRAAIGARQMDTWLRHFPIGWTASREQLRALDVASDARDCAQADNLSWIMRQEGPQGKVLIYAHNGHLSTGPVTWKWAPVSDEGVAPLMDPAPYAHEVAGIYLKRRFGDQLFTIGNLIGEGVIGSQTFQHPLRPVPADGLDTIGMHLGARQFILSLKEAPTEALGWLRQERQMGRGFSLPGLYDVSLNLTAAASFDALFYVDRVKPACPITPGS